MERAGRLGGLQASFERWHLPVLVGFVSTVLTVLVSQALAIREKDQFRMLVESGARRVRAEVGAALDTRMHAMSTLAREWQDRFLPLRGAWESDVRLILAQSPGLQSIGWIESNGELSWEYPPQTSLPSLDVDQLRAEKTALERPVVLGPIVPPDGRPRLRILAPLVESGEHQGWLAATFSSQELFADILENIDHTFAVDVAAGNTDLFRVDRESADGQPRAVTYTTLALPGGLDVRIGVEPSDAMLAASESYLPRATLAGGLVLSGLLMFALWLHNVASQRARRLEVEIGERERADASIRHLNAELEERVRNRTEELSRSNDGLRKFASFLSHELRQPLGAQLIWIDLLESQSGIDDAGRRHIESIRTSARKMSELITAQLALTTAIANGAAEERVELDAVAREAISDLTPDLEAVGAKVRVGRLPAIRGDARQLCELFRNLIENAIKYRREEVPSEVSIGSHAAESDGCEIEVEDNGRGFALADAVRIFEPSERLDAERAGPRGQGLGLAICKMIVERHGGRISAEGRPGDGATFRIVFPNERICK